MRIVTREEPGRSAIEASGAECLIGTPDRLATLRGALDGVTVACWLLATARGSPAHVRALHGSRLESFLCQAIDTTMRGFVYEVPGVNGPAVEGERIVRLITTRNAIPLALVRAGPHDPDAWVADARGAVDSLLERTTGAAVTTRYPKT